MHHIIYLSWAAAPFSDKHLQELLLLARWRNKRLGITGILLYGNEQFLQVLEGEEAAVRDIYTKIKQDARHGNIITFADKPITQRTFGKWAMAFQPTTPEQFTHVVDYLGATDVKVDTTHLSYSDLHLFDLLRSFVLP